MASCRTQEFKLSYFVVQQRTSAGKHAGQPLIHALETVFNKNDLLAVQVDIPRTGYLYAFQADDQGTFDVLYPPASGSPPTQAGQRVRLPAEPTLWLGFIDSSVTLAWSPRRIESLEKAIDNSEVEEEGIRAIREPKDARDLEQKLKQMSSATRREVVSVPSARSVLTSNGEVVAYQIKLAVN